MAEKTKTVHKVEVGRGGVFWELALAWMRWLWSLGYSTEVVTDAVSRLDERD